MRSLVGTSHQPTRVANLFTTKGLVDYQKWKLTDQNCLPAVVLVTSVEAITTKYLFESQLPHQALSLFYGLQIACANWTNISPKGQLNIPRTI